MTRTLRIFFALAAAAAIGTSASAQAPAVTH